MAQTMRIGIVGCGKIAQVSHAPGFMKVPGTHITALCDPIESRTLAIREKFAPEAMCFKDFKRMLAEGALDAVTICTPNRLHAPMTLEAFKHGLHVLCEKPMAATLPEATRMINSARKAKRVLQINLSMRYSALYTTVAKWVHQGKIGEPLHIRCIRAGGTTPDKHWSPGAKWFVRKSEQGGLVLDIGIHMADLMAWIVGPVSRVAALVDTRTPGIDVTDHVGALFRFANGATGVLELSWSLPSGAGLLEVYGSKGRIRVGFDDRSAKASGIECTQVLGAKNKVSHPALVRGVKNSFASFVAAVKGRIETPTPGELGRDALAICDAIAKSGAQGKFATVKSY